MRSATLFAFAHSVFDVTNKRSTFTYTLSQSHVSDSHIHTHAEILRTAEQRVCDVQFVGGSFCAAHNSSARPPSVRMKFQYRVRGETLWQPPMRLRCLHVYWFGDKFEWRSVCDVCRRVLLYISLRRWFCMNYFMTLCVEWKGGEFVSNSIKPDTNTFMNNITSLYSEYGEYV